MIVNKWVSNAFIFSRVAALAEPWQQSNWILWLGAAIQRDEATTTKTLRLEHHRIITESILGVYLVETQDAQGEAQLPRHAFKQWRVRCERLFSARY
jgi:hypothetical protein